VIQRTIAVLEFPPSEDLSIFVSGEFLYGICASEAPFFASAFRAITWVKKNKDLLICCPSLTLIEADVDPLTTE